MTNLNPIIIFYYIIIINSNIFLLKSLKCMNFQNKKASTLRASENRLLWTPTKGQIEM